MPARSFAFGLLAFGAVASAQEPAPTPGPSLDPAPQVVVPDDPQRAQAKAEFLQAREAYTNAVTAALTSEQVTNFVRRLSVRVRLKRTEEDLFAARQALAAAQSAGPAATEQARQLAQQVAALEAEADQLRRARPDDPAAAIGGAPSQAEAARWITREMAEETQQMADTLDTRELERRTRRLHRLGRFAQVAGTALQNMRRNPGGGFHIEIGGDGTGGGVVPAGATAAAPAPPATPPSAADPELGPSTTVPPTFPERVEKRGGQ